MENLDVRIVSLPPMRVASFYAYSASPETDAWEKTVAWAKSHGYWQQAPTVRIFGFNNPEPSEGSPNYGYEFWVTVDSAVRQNRQVKIKQFIGGMYAVIYCDVPGSPWDFIPAAWGKLVRWFESSHYKQGNHQWLEEHLSRGNSNVSGFALDLYLPIME